MQRQNMVLCQYTSFINDCNIILFIDEMCNINVNDRLHLTFHEKPYENRKFFVNSIFGASGYNCRSCWIEKKTRKLSLYIM